jgi:tetratricopeptide (TPR) repeat protein
MKTPAKVLSGLFLALLITVTAMGQDMKPDAGKLYNDGNQKLKAGNYTGAVESYDQALAIEKDYRIFYQRGIALKKLKKLDDAKNSFEESLKQKPDFEAAYNALGGVYFSMGNYQKAVENFEKVLQSANKTNVKNAVKKNLSLAYAKMGNNAMTEGNSKKATEYLEKAVENSNYDAAYLSLAKLYTQLGDYAKAIPAAEKALKYRSSIGKGGPYYYLGVAYKGVGDTTKAKEMFNKAKSDATYKKTAEYELSLLK